MFRTRNSIYEIDEANSSVRRLEGVKDPTPRQGPDGEWKTFVGMMQVLAPGDERVSYFFDWDGEGHGTLTSQVEEIFYSA